MGSQVVISVVTTDFYWAENRVKSAVAEIKRVNKLLSTLRVDSQANLINRHAGIAPVKISGELFRLIDRSLKIAELTRGAFDITYGANDSYQKMELNPVDNTIFLKEKAMRIYFGGVAKGYAIDRAKYILQLEGVSDGVINAGGALTAWGVQIDGQDWTLDAADANRETKTCANFSVSNMAVASVTKSNYLNNAINAVYVTGTSAEFAGAMAAPLMRMGIKTGIELTDNLQQLACVFVDSHNQLFASKYMNALS